MGCNASKKQEPPQASSTHQNPQLQIPPHSQNNRTSEINNNSTKRGSVTKDWKNVIAYDNLKEEPLYNMENPFASNQLPEVVIQNKNEINGM